MRSELWVATIGDFEDFLCRPVTVLTPSVLCRSRGIDLDSIGESTIFIDAVLGYAIIQKCAIDISGGAGGPRTKNIVKNFEFDEGPGKSSPGSGPPKWYLVEMEGWPAGTGKGQRVACAGRRHHRRSSRPAETPGSCRLLQQLRRGCRYVLLGRARDTLRRSHWAGKRGGTERRSVAPDCQLIVCQVRPEKAKTTLADVLLMMSWAVHRWDVRIFSLISASRSCSREQTSSVW